MNPQSTILSKVGGCGPRRIGMCALCVDFYITIGMFVTDRVDE